MTTTNTSEIESLRSFALASGEIEFAHLCTAALAGEAWAMERVSYARREWCFAPCNEERVLGLIQNADTTRPDGARARSTVVV